MNTCCVGKCHELSDLSDHPLYLGCMTAYRLLTVPTRWSGWNVKFRGWPWHPARAATRGAACSERRSSFEPKTMLRVDQLMWCHHVEVLSDSRTVVVGRQACTADPVVPRPRRAMRCSGRSSARSRPARTRAAASSPSRRSPRSRPSSGNWASEVMDVHSVLPLTS